MRTQPAEQSFALAEGGAELKTKDVAGARVLTCGGRVRPGPGLLSVAQGSCLCRESHEESDAFCQTW